LKVIVSSLSFAMADSLRLDAAIEMSVEPSPSLSTSIASPSALLFELDAAAAVALSSSNGPRAAVFVGEKAWVPLTLAFGMILLILSKYGQPVLRNGAMILLDCETSQL
jgi:hypothetical protein